MPDRSDEVEQAEQKVEGKCLHLLQGQVLFYFEECDSGRSNFLGFDRPDIQYAVQEVFRRLATLSSKPSRKIKRLFCFLKHQPRLIWNFPMQDVVEIFDV